LRNGTSLSQQDCSLFMTRRRAIKPTFRIRTCSTPWCILCCSLFIPGDPIALPCVFARRLLSEISQNSVSGPHAAALGCDKGLRSRDALPERPQVRHAYRHIHLLTAGLFVDAHSEFETLYLSGGRFRKLG